MNQPVLDSQSTQNTDISEDSFCITGDPFHRQELQAEQDSLRRERIMTEIQNEHRKRRLTSKEPSAVSPTPKPSTMLSEESPGSEKRYTSADGQVYTVPDWLLNQQQDLPVNLYSRGRASLERTGSDYREAGFPEGLVEEAEWQNSTTIYRKRRGAQFAAGDLSEKSMRQSLQQAEIRANKQIHDEETAFVPARQASVRDENPFLPISNETENFSEEDDIPQKTAATDHSPAAAAPQTVQADNSDLYAQPVRLKGNASYPPEARIVPETRIADSSLGWQVITDEKPKHSTRQLLRHRPVSDADHPIEYSDTSNAAKPMKTSFYAASDHLAHDFSIDLPKQTDAEPPPVQIEAPENQEEARQKAREKNLNLTNGILIALLTLVCILCILGIGRKLLAAQEAEETAQLIRTQREYEYHRCVENHPFRYREQIEQTAAKYNLQPAFVAAIVLNESSFRADATSSVGARGLMQLMDDTASWIYEKIGTGGYNFDNLYTAETNIEYGCWYLNYLSTMFHGDPVLVAAAFHAGQGEISNWLNDSRYSSDGYRISLNDMPEGPTRTYVNRVTHDYADYQNLYYVLNEGETL